MMIFPLSTVSKNDLTQLSVPCGVSISCGLPAIATTIAHPVAVVAGRQSPRSAAHFVQKYLSISTIV